MGCNLCYQICPDFCIDVALKPGATLKPDATLKANAHARNN